MAVCAGRGFENRFRPIFRVLSSKNFALSYFVLTLPQTLRVDHEWLTEGP